MHGAAADTICALATPAGEAALGVVRLSGPAALALLRELCEGEPPGPWRVKLLALRDPESGELLDRALVTTMVAPRSYTGEDVVEISAHGGRLNVRRLLEVLVRRGARLAQPGEFTRRAFVNGRLDLAQAEAVLEVISARGERALRNAQAVLGGALGDRVRRMRSALVRAAAELEARIDFADEPEVGEGGAEALRDALRAVAAEAAALQESYAQGQRLAGIAVALVGAVNAGKSSLFNALLGTTRAVVAEEEGTTRDYLEAELPWEGIAVTLVDTAGQRGEARSTALERQGRALGAERVARCDVVVEVLDLAAGAGGRPVARPAAGVIAANKRDLLAAEEVARRCAALRVGAPEVAVVGVSALRGEGLAELRGAILAAALGAEGAVASDEPETVQITSARHSAALGRAVAELNAAVGALPTGAAPELVVEHVRGALGALGEITGESFTEDVLDAIFARFCIGK